MLTDAPAEHHAHPLKLLRPEHPVVLIRGFTFITLSLEVIKCYLDSLNGGHFGSWRPKPGRQPAVASKTSSKLALPEEHVAQLS